MLADRIELLARRALDDRPTAVYALAWYPRARAYCQELANKYTISLEIVVGIISALSPQNTWKNQSETTHTILENLRDGKPISGPGFNRNKEKALKIFNAHKPPLSYLKGLKVRAFYRCILGDTDSVCIDRWAFRAAYWGAVEPKTVTTKRYHEAAAAYRIAAARLQVVYPELRAQLSPRNVQALVWAYIRDPGLFYPSLF